MNRKITLLLGLILSFGILYSFSGQQKDFGTDIVPNPEFENLQVLPKDISEDALMNIMESFSDALGVKCSFCHVPGATPQDMDFASDDNHHKNTARGMMKMTVAINKQFFDNEDHENMDVTCFTCHQGEKKPAKQVMEKKEEKEAEVIEAVEGKVKAVSEE